MPRTIPGPKYQYRKDMNATSLCALKRRLELGIEGKYSHWNAQQQITETLLINAVPGAKGRAEHRCFAQKMVSSAFGCLLQNALSFFDKKHTHIKVNQSQITISDLAFMLITSLLTKIATIIFPLLIDVALQRTHQRLIKRRQLSNQLQKQLLQAQISSKRNNNNQMPSSLDSFSEIFSKMWGSRGGGRRPQLPNENALDAYEETWMRSSNEGQSRLIIVQITDVS